MKRVPIKFFAKRESDNSRTEGGGNPPNWILSGKELKSQSEKLGISFNKLKDEFIKREEKFIPVTIKTTISEKAKAKSHRPEIAKLFEHKSTDNNLIGMVGEDDILVKIDNLESFEIISKKIRNFDSNAYSISCIEDIQLFRPYIKERQEKENYKIRLFLKFRM